MRKPRINFRLVVQVFVTFTLQAHLLAAQANSDAVSILLLSGKDGKPITRHRLLTFYGTTAEEAIHHKHSIDLTTDDAGVATLSQFPADARWIEVWPDWLRICQDKPKRDFSIAELAATGARTNNSCGKFTGEGKAGRLVLFARPLTFIERMNL